MDATRAAPELPPNVPRTLELEAWLSYGLTASDPKSRRLSLEELSAGGVRSRELLEHLKTLASGDPDPGCRDLAARILAAENAKEQAMRLAGKIQLSPASFKDLIESADPTLRSALLKAIRKAPPEDLLELWRQQILGESDPAVLEMGFSLLARFGREADASFALSALYSEHPGVVCAAIDLLHARNLTMFREQVGHVLAADDLTIRLHAVRRLRSIDPHEASLFLESLLGDPDPFVRQGALHELMLVPFQEAENLYLRYLGTEVTPLLLVTAGLSIAFNPHPDLPLKVFDLFLVSRGLKKHIVQLIVGQVVETISQAGILTTPKAEYLAELKRKLAGRRDALFLQLTLRDLENADVEVRRAALERLRPQAREAKVRQALQEARERETDEELKALFTELIGEDQPATLEDFLEAAQTGAFFDHPPKLQRQLLGTITDSERYRQARRNLKILFLGSPPRSVVLEVIRLIGEFGDATDTPELLPLLQHAETPIVAAAIRACGRVNLDALLPQLNPLLQHEDPRIKTAALEIFVRTDKEGAVQYLQTMCRAPQPMIRRNALALMPLLDYPSAEPLLFAMIKAERHKDIRDQIGTMIAINPSLEGIRTLYLATHDDKGERLPEAAELWELACQSAIGIVAPDRETLDGKIRDVAEKEKVRAETPAPSYAFTQVAARQPAFQRGPAGQPAISPTVPAAAEAFDGERFRQRAWDLRFHVAAVVALLLPFWYMISSSEEGSMTPQQFGGSGSLKKVQFIHSTQTPANSSSQGVLRSNADSILGGSSYASLMSAAAQERQESVGEIDRRRIEFLEALAEDQQADLMVRFLAAAELNPDLTEGKAQFQAGRLTDAREAFRRVLANPDASPLTRAWAWRGLFEIAARNGSREEYLEAYGAFLEEIDSLPWCAGSAKLGDFKNQMQEFLKLSEMALDLQKSKDLTRAIMGEDKVGQEDAEDRVKSILDAAEGFRDGRFAIQGPGTP